MPQLIQRAEHEVEKTRNKKWGKGGRAKINCVCFLVAPSIQHDGKIIKREIKAFEKDMKKKYKKNQRKATHTFTR